MSPQFVDFDADGQLDIVAGIFDGSPHLVRGSKAGWGKPEQILDKDGQRIVGNAFWNFGTKKWDSTNRHDAAGHSGEAHLTSAIAFDIDGDGDFDLLLGDHRSGRVFVRRNEGSNQKPVFAKTNEALFADGRAIDVPGTVATLRLVDWNGDGRLDLGCGSMGDAYGSGEGGGVVLFLNTGTGKAASFGAPITLLERSKKGGSEPTRPDSGLYMDFADHDGDGDLDMVVGGYAHWTPPARQLSEAEQKRVDELKVAVAKVDEDRRALMQSIDEVTKGLTGEAGEGKRNEILKQSRETISAIGRKLQELRKELASLAPGGKRESFVWFYENTDVKNASAKRK